MLRGQVSCWVPAPTRAARALPGFTLCRFLTPAQGLAHITLSKPFRGTQQAGEMGKGQQSAKSYTGGTALSSSTDWGASSCRQPCREQQRAMRHQGPLQQRNPTVPCSALKEHCQQAEGGHSSPLLSPPENSLSTGTALGSPAQHRNGHTRVNPVQGHKGGEVTGVSYRQGELGRAGIVSLTWRREGSGDLTSLCQCLRGRSEGRA